MSARIWDAHNGADLRVIGGHTVARFFEHRSEPNPTNRRFGKQGQNAASLEFGDRRRSRNDVGSR